MKKISHNVILPVVTLSLLLVLGVASSSVMAQQQVTRFLKLQGNADSAKTPAIQSLNLAPQSRVDLFQTDSSYLNSGSGKNANFRLVGTGVFDSLLSNPLTGDQVTFLGNTNTKLAIGYTTSNPDSIDLKVNGAIRVTGLVHSASSPKKLCVNDFGVLIAEPNPGDCSGYSVASTDADAVCQTWPASKTKQATSDATGCQVGTFSNGTDTGTTWNWTCAGIGSGSSASCSSPRSDLNPGVCKKLLYEYSSQPATNTSSGCISGSYADSADSATEYLWSCTDNYSVTCRARKAKQVWSGIGCGACPNGSYALSTPQDTDSATQNGDVEQLVVNRNTNTDVFSLRPTKKIRKYTLFACSRSNSGGTVDKETQFTPRVWADIKGQSGQSVLYDDGAPLCAVTVDEYQQVNSWDWVSYNIPWGMKEK